MNEQMLLKMENIIKRFYGTEVLHGVNLDLRKGEILGLVGENGAGKSTLMSIMGGVYSLDGGAMSINGQPYAPSSPNDAAKAGIAFIHQEFSLFSNLSVAENLFVDSFPKKGKFAINRKMINARTQTYIDLFKLDITTQTKVENLPMGIRQIIEISKALEKKARIIIFDEPTTSLSQKEKAELFSVIEKLRVSGVSIIYISHILEDVMHLCDRTTVLRDGNTVGTFANEGLEKKTIIRMMVGRELNQAYPSIVKETGSMIYEVQDFVRKGSTAPVSFFIRRGEIVGLFGLMGAGRTELLNALFGLEPAQSGSIRLEGMEMHAPAPEACIRRGMAYVTENRRNEGLIMSKSVGENAVLVILRRLTGKLRMVDRNEEKRRAKDLVERFSVKTSNYETQEIQNLSGGNQQKVVIAKWIASEPKLFFMDEPTRGVDVGAKYEIYTYINELAKNGCGVLVVSSEMEEVMGICDRILVMYKNEIVADIPKEQFNQERIISFALEGGMEDAG